MNGRTNSSGSSVNDLQIPLDPCTNLECVAGNAQVELTWTDPLNKYATPEGEQAQDPQPLVSVWDHTILVRKTGSQPTGPHDGTTVVSSSTRNQYQSTPYTDTGLIDGTIYHYGVFAYNTAGLASDGVFASATPVLGTPLGNLAVGTVVKTPINGTPKEFLIVHQGKPSSGYDDSCDGTWLLMRDIYTKMAWDNSSNDYEYSDIHSYLNRTFLNLFDDDIKNIIKQVKIPYYNGRGINGAVASGANGLSCKIFLLSFYEVGLSNSSGSHFSREGDKLSYFEFGVMGDANSKCIATYNGIKSYWWLRTPDTSTTDDICHIDTSGMDRAWGHDASYGVRPALVLPSDILVDNISKNILAYDGNTAV